MTANMNKTCLMIQLRKEVEAQYQKELSALAVLGHLPRRNYLRHSYRECVMGALTESWQSVYAISQLCNIDEKRVRGVLYAAPLLKQIARHRLESRSVFRCLRETTA